MAKKATAQTASPTKFQKFCKRNFGFIFIIIWLAGFLVFRLYPFLSSLVYSFSDFHLFNGIKEWGLMNYKEIFTTKKIMSSLGITFSYAFITVPMKLTFALFIAYILNYKIKGVNLFRTAYYIPSILGGSVAIAVLWKALFRDQGVINSIIRIFFGGEGVNWLADPKYALFIISLLRVWQFGSAMVLFLAALKNVPTELYEAATLDGASKARQFFSITLPLITPVVFYNLVTQLCQAFQEFNGPYIITQGGPRGATTLFSLLIYNRAFQQNEMGMASAMAWVLFVIVMVLSIVAFLSQKYWVYYGDEK